MALTEGITRFIAFSKCSIVMQSMLSFLSSILCRRAIILASCTRATKSAPLKIHLFKHYFINSKLVIMLGKPT